MIFGARGGGPVRGEDGESRGDTSEVKAPIPAAGAVGPVKSPRRPRSLLGWLVAAVTWAVVASVVAAILFAGRGDLNGEVERLRQDVATQRGRLDVRGEQLEEAEGEAARLSAEMEECREASRASQRALRLWEDFVISARGRQGFETIRAFIRLQDFRREWGRTAKACVGEGAEVFFSNAPG